MKILSQKREDNIRSLEQRLGQWKAFDRVLMMLNSLAPKDNETADQMRRRIYGEVMSMRPD